MNFLEIKSLEEDIREQILERYMEIHSLIASFELEAHFERIFARLSEKERKQTRVLLRCLRKWRGIGDLSAKELLLRIGQLWAVSEEIWRKEKKKRKARNPFGEKEATSLALRLTPFQK